MWAVGGFRGVISKIDLLFAVAGAITADDLKRYFALARMELSEDDPTPDLNEDDRWFAHFANNVATTPTAVLVQRFVQSEQQRQLLTNQCLD
ncbi:MAG: higA [Candidatus Sulfotelmatobacter sp.]|nr:higA [Candidatus Sulfotelmatobacter sp.]